MYIFFCDKPRIFEVWMTTIINLIKSIRFRFDFVLRNEFQWENNFGNIDNSPLCDLLMSKVTRDLIGWPRSRDPELTCDWSECRNVEWRNPLDVTSDRCIIRINEMPGPDSHTRAWPRVMNNEGWAGNAASPELWWSGAGRENIRCIMWVWPQIKISGESETVTNDRVSRFTFDVRAHWD